jgi:TRAP-type mannitol/chloroaromatic compound transport system permease small subunit
MIALIRFLERITGGAGMLAAWVVVPLIFATAFEVFSRYLFNAPTIWSFELGYMAMGTHFLLGAAYTLREGGHIRIDIFYNAFSARTKAWVDALGFLMLMLPASWWLSYALWNYAAAAYLSGEGSGQSAWNPVIWPFRMVFFSGFLLFALQGTVQLLKALAALLGRDIEAEALDAETGRGPA